ncbi:DNA repair protein RecO [Gluconobacter kanchanaburiensis]|uniref:DNA repair protein RecO n=1 Tax=Gluconobacter kanchanaburiensis NBRC 103587 TaxID=1307948 RepID=A0A511B6L0_9PROT|nr:DNA repair protein RecO [Gluconobacter kanchanaburiensis]MBF0861156.1 DNA repair protein RecO [Gluconobacter kanchanaburiensis]GBR70773.1 DNA repair protein RecO [Gluconobacter kanchanaburiensis NBRC 103587]GEK96028.1 DNA repair protein RecO [Gluconobacter kanchanaburiensis NBRC 103587]
MEWEAAALVLSVRPYGEGSALVHLFSEEHGVSHGMARGGASRRQSSLWQTGNLVMARWRARLADQLGTLTAEPVQCVAGRILDAPLQLEMVSSACALVDGALPQGEAYPELFMRLVRLVTLISVAPEPAPMGDYLRWEAQLLASLGYGLDLSECAVTGSRENLLYVSPRSGRAVSGDAAGDWRDRLLPLPPLMANDTDDGTPEDWRDGLVLTGHFLSRWVFGVRHQPLPAARERLIEYVQRLQAGPTGSEKSGQ